jgi:hypothetical protein
MAQGLLGDFQPQGVGYGNILMDEPVNYGAVDPAQVQAATEMGMLMMPSSGISEMLGYAPDPFSDEYLPSTMELVRRGDIEGLGYQGLGVLGDVMYAASPFAPFLAPVAAGAKAARTGRLAKQGEALELLTDAERVAVTKELPYVGTDEFPLENLLGEEIVYIPADRLATGRMYEGLAEAPIERPAPLKGGQKYGTMRETQEQGLGFASLDPAIAERIALSGAKYGIIGAMDTASQLSNKTMGDIVAQQVQAYNREGMISNTNMKKLSAKLRNFGRANLKKVNAAKAAGKKVDGGDLNRSRMANMPDINDPEIFDWLNKNTFETRRAFSDQLDKAGSRELGSPSVQRILSETIDPQQAGALPLQGNVLVRLSGEAPIDVAKEGGFAHPSYPIGILGEPVAQIKYGVRGEDLFSERVAEWLEAGGNPSRMARMMNMSLPKTTVTQDKLQLFPTGAPQAITSARQARLLVDFMNGNWRTTQQSVTKEGGLGAAEVGKAFQNNALAETLTPYSQDAITKGAKDGSLVFYGLGIGNPSANKAINGNQGQIYFGLKRNMDYNKNYGINNPELSPEEIAVVGVMNNELGQAGAGLGVPTSMLKAIEEGATVLDAYAVPSKANPRGFLPKYYSQFGFREVERIPFDEKYVRNPKYGGSERKYKALINQWRKSGWDESMGNPDMVIMKWKGDENARRNAVRDYVEQSGASFGSKDAGIIGRAEEKFGTRSGGGSGGQQLQGGQSDAGGNRGGLLGDGSVLPSRFSRAIGEVSVLTDPERRALGLLD